MFLERQANDALVHSMTNGASSPTTSSVFSTPSLHRIKKSPRLSVTAIDSAYGSTSSMTKREPRPRLPADSRRGGDEDNANDIDLSGSPKHKLNPPQFLTSSSSYTTKPPPSPQIRKPVWSFYTNHMMKCCPRNFFSFNFLN